MFTDDAGRSVELPGEITRVAPSGSVATMILATLCPEYMVCVSSTPSSSQYRYLPSNLMELPTTGQLYGSKSTINLESLIDADPQVIIDLGDRKGDIASDMNALQRTTGIAVIFLEADLPHIAAAYRELGALLGLQEKAEELASLIDLTLATASENSAKIPADQRKTVMFTTGTSGLNTNARGCVQAQVIDIVGADNAIIVDDVSNAGGGNVIGLEQLYNFDPDVILFSGGSIYETVAGLPAWTELSAIKNGAYYEIPYLPYNWMANPPSINMILGVWWLGNLLYPEIYDFDVRDVVRHIYDLFWKYELSDEELHVMLANSSERVVKSGL
jgi:iron complex transport system substrate-binding protein